VFAPNSKHRKQITPAKRDRGGKTRSLDEDQTPAERKAAMTWAKRLKRVFTKSPHTAGGAALSRSKQGWHTW